MKIRSSLLYLVLGMAGFLLAEMALSTPFVTAKDKTYLYFTLGQTVATELIMKDTDAKGNWPDTGFEITHTNYTLQASHGIADQTQATVSLSYKEVKPNKDWGGVSKDDVFSGIGEIALGAKRMLYSGRPFYVAGLVRYAQPGADYHPDGLIVPGNETREYTLGISSAWYGDLPLMVALDLGYAIRTTPANNQNRNMLQVYYFVSNISLGLFYGMVTTNGGTDLGVDATKFAELNETFNYYGFTVGGNVTGVDVNLSYTAKMESGMTNSDVNTGITLGIGKTI